MQCCCIRKSRGRDTEKSEIRRKIRAGLRENRKKRAQKGWGLMLRKNMPQKRRKRSGDASLNWGENVGGENPGTRGTTPMGENNPTPQTTQKSYVREGITFTSDQTNGQNWGAVRGDGISQGQAAGVQRGGGATVEAFVIGKIVFR